MFPHDLRKRALRDEDLAGVLQGVFEGLLQRHVEGVAGAEKIRIQQDLVGWSKGKGLGEGLHNFAIAFGASCAHNGSSRCEKLWSDRECKFLHEKASEYSAFSASLRLLKYSLMVLRCAG